MKSLNQHSQYYMTTLVEICFVMLTLTEDMFEPDESLYRYIPIK